MRRPNGPRETGAGLTAFGLSLLFEEQPPGAWEEKPLNKPILCVLSAKPEAIAESWSGLDKIGWKGTIDGAPFVVEHGLAGDHRFVHGAHPHENGALAVDTYAVHHLSADASTLRCAPANPSEPSWWRVVLDSVLFTVALLQGYEALHAAALATPGDGVIAITATTGGGKSTLMSEMLKRGLSLMADDVLILETVSPDDPPLAHPAPPLATIPEPRLPTLAGSPEPISSLEDEHWIAVPTYPEPLPLRTLVVLDRRPGSKLSLTKIEDPLAPLMGSLMNFPRTPERQRARFELASVLAARCELLRLTVDISTPPETLADALGISKRC